MVSFIWTEELNIGVEAIDKQHKTMVSDIGIINDVITKHSNKIIVHEMFDKLITNSKLHFLEEDKVMLIYNYPAASEHVKQHEIFIDMINNCKRSYVPSEIGKIQKELLQLHDWLVKHILEYDKQYMERIYI